MTREEVLELIRAHVADELELDPARITEATHFREDLAADSLDLYTLVQEVEDSYGVRCPTGRAPASPPPARRSTSCSPMTPRRGPDRCACWTTCSSVSRRIWPGRRSRTRPGPSG